MWDQVADKLHPTYDVLEARKNILLYKLNENLEDKAIDVVKRISKIKLEREELQKRILVAEKQREKQEFSIRQKRMYISQKFLQLSKYFSFPFSQFVILKVSSFSRLSLPDKLLKERRKSFL